VEKDGELIEALQELERLVGALNMEDEETRGLVVACLARARAAAPGNTGLLATEGLIHARQGRAAEAAPLLEKYLQSDSRGELASQAMTALARIQRQQNNIGGARRLLHAAITASPENASAWEDLADCHQESGEAAQAEECWRRALQEDPDRARSLAALGEVYAKRGDAERAAPLLERALLLGEERGRVTPHLIECHLTAGRLDGADALATDWVEEHPESLTAWMCLTRVRHKLKDAPAVTRCLAEARRLGTTPRQQADISMLDFSLRQPFEFAEYRRVGLLHSIGAKEAETLAWKLTAGVYAREAHPDILMLAARLAERAGNVQLAAKCLAEALTRLGDAPVSERLRLVRLYSEAGDRPAAKAALTAVEAVSPGNAEAASIRRTLDSQVAVEPPPEPVASPVEVAVTVEEAEPAGFLTRLNRWLSGLLGR
jgi:tetratricopeptide (TPR) repeat protein